MKLLASALSLVLVGVLGIWLWFDATAEARGDLPGVVVSAGQAPVTAGPGVQQPDEGTAAVADQLPDGAEATAAEPSGEEQVEARMLAVETVLATLRASRGDLADLARRAADDVAEDVTAPAGPGSADRQPAPARPGPVAPQPQPVQPAPVTPPGMCWDDEEWEECDDDSDDDDWDDDDWDDDDWDDD